VVFLTVSLPLPLRRMSNVEDEDLIIAYAVIDDVGITSKP
jgi:hypothetical protein